MATRKTCRIVPAERRDLLGRLPDAGRSALLVRALEDMTEYDLYDVLAELGYGRAPRTREHRTEAFGYTHAAWLAGVPAPGAATLSALARQFARAGIDGLKSPEVFQTPEVARAGGIRGLRALGRPVDILRETKEHLFRRMSFINGEIKERWVRVLSRGWHSQREVHRRG